MHALRNIGYGAVLDRMIDLASTKSPEEYDNYLRVYIIHGFIEFRKERKVFWLKFPHKFFYFSGFNQILLTFTSIDSP